MNSPLSNEVPTQQLEHYTALEYILLGDLRDLLEEPADEWTSKWLLAVLNALLDTLPHELQLQQQGGYLSEVLEQYPNWYDQVDQLWHQKRALYAKLFELRDQVVRDAPFSDIALTLQHELHDWANSVVAHHRHERRIVQTAFNLEVGTGD